MAREPRKSAKRGRKSPAKKRPAQENQKRKVSKAVRECDRVAMSDAPPCASDLLSRDEKHDRIDSSQTLVRGKRFRGSFMEATNGGALYEDILRSDRPSIPRDEPDTIAGDGVAAPGDTGLQNVLGGSDERRLIADTSRIPARAIGLLKIVPELGPERYGTAWLIGPRTLATAAHNLFHPEVGETRRLDVGLAYDGRSARGGWHRVIDNAFDLGWRHSPAEGSPFDYAVIKIANAEVGNKLGWFGFADYEDAKFGNMALNIFGYPLDLLRFHMYGVRGRVLHVDGGRIFYDCDAGGGMSGGPVIARFPDGQRVAVGIHVAGGLHSNVGTRINDAAFKLFEAHRNW
jgi:V8-like Glu-specific endopeptidase